MERSLLASASQSTVGEELRDDAASAAVGEYEAAVAVVEPATSKAGAAATSKAGAAMCRSGIASSSDVEGRGGDVQRPQSRTITLIEDAAELAFITAFRAELVRRGICRIVDRDGIEEIELIPREAMDSSSTSSPSLPSPSPPLPRAIANEPEQEPPSKIGRFNS